MRGGGGVSTERQRQRDRDRKMGRDDECCKRCVRVCVLGAVTSVREGRDGEI